MKRKTTSKTDQPKTYLLKTWWEYVKSQKQELYLFIGFHLLFALVLRYFYPIADVSTDTGGYMFNSYLMETFKYGGTRPLGYSNFISLLHSFSTTPVFLAQYVIHCISIFFFYFSVTYFFRIQSAWTRILLLSILMLCIPALYMTNFIMSDGLFTSLTIIILTLLIWVLQTGNVWFILSLISITVYTITVRYIGLIYPALIIPVFYFSVRNKLFATIYSLLLACSLFMYIEHIRSNTMRDQGTRVFSAFSGWQKANNALHVIPHIDTTMPVVETDDREMFYIDTIVNLSYKHYNSIYPDSNEVTYDFIWIEKSPLKLALEYSANQIREKNYHRAWNRIGPRFSDYGDMLMTQYFGEYLRYYIWNNTKRTFHPPAEILEAYADSSTAKLKIINMWFDREEDSKIEPRADILRPALKASPFLFSLYWIIYIGSIIGYIVLIVKKRFTYNSLLFKTITLLIVFTGAYTLASIYAAPVNLRFLLPLRTLIITLPFLLVYTFNVSKPEKHET